MPTSSTLPILCGTAIFAAKMAGIASVRGCYAKGVMGMLANNSIETAPTPLAFIGEIDYVWSEIRAAKGATLVADRAFGNCSRIRKPHRMW